MWNVIHTWAITYPIEPTDRDRIRAAAYFNNLPNLIPCPSCGSSFAEILLEYPVEPSLNDRFALCEWVNTVHNLVNEKLGKDPVSLETFLSNYNATLEGGQPRPRITSHVSAWIVKNLYHSAYGT